MMVVVLFGAAMAVFISVFGVDAVRRHRSEGRFVRRYSYLAHRR